jgi:type IV pilus assembly protein PilM
MLFSRKAVGLEICQEEVRCVLIGGKRDFPRLEAFQSLPLPDEAVRFSSKELNILLPSHFVSTVKECHLRLLTKIKRVSVSLPDSIGRIMLLDLETRFRNKDEGKDLIRWKLKKSFSQDVGDIHLDYQILGEKETGEISTLVALISRPLVNQYEDLLQEAGLEPNRIDFSSFNRYRLFSERLDLSEYSAYVTYFGRTLAILIFNGGVLEFYRSKDIAGDVMDADRVFREINSSFLVYREKYPGHMVNQVFCNALADEIELFRAIVAEATGLEPVTLDVEKVVTRHNDLTIGKKNLSQLTAAIGAATGNL